MSLTSWAASSAERFLAPLGDRWLLVRTVAECAHRVAVVLPAEDHDLLLAAAYLHDVGHAPALAARPLATAAAAPARTRSGGRRQGKPRHHAAVTETSQGVDRADPLTACRK